METSFTAAQLRQRATATASQLAIRTVVSQGAAVAVCAASEDALGVAIESQTEAAHAEMRYLVFSFVADFDIPLDVSLLDAEAEHASVFCDYIAYATSMLQISELSGGQLFSTLGLQSSGTDPGSMQMSQCALFLQVLVTPRVEASLAAQTSGDAVALFGLVAASEAASDGAVLGGAAASGGGEGAGPEPVLLPLAQVLFFAAGHHYAPVSIAARKLQVSTNWTQGMGGPDSLTTSQLLPPPRRIGGVMSQIQVLVSVPSMCLKCSPASNTLLSAEGAETTRQLRHRVCTDCRGRLAASNSAPSRCRMWQRCATRLERHLCGNCRADSSWVHH